jgi:sugar lactone lactonase YvrE
MSERQTPYAEWIMTTVVGTGAAGYSGDGGAATSAILNNPFDVIFDVSGNLVFSDTYNHCIRRVDYQTGVIETVAGTGAAGYSGDGGPGQGATFNQPYGLAIDGDGAIYTADRLNGVVRRIDGATGVVSTVAGTGEKAFSGDGGPAREAGMVEPNGLVFSRDMNRLFIADVADNRVRVLDIARGEISTFAGNGAAAHDGDGGPAVAAGVFGARAVGIRSSDDGVYIMERQGSSVRLASSDGIFDRPKEMTVNGNGGILVVDTENHAIRFIDWRADRVSTIAGDGAAGFSGDGLVATQSQLARPHGVTIGPDGAFYIGDTENNRIRKVFRPD